jgi:hypothetical protein
MWMRNSAGLVATLLGPCRVTTDWKGTKLTVLEKTNDPSDFSFDFEIDASRPVTFTLAIRKPAWATGKSISYPCTEKDAYLLITRTWRPGEVLHLRLYPEVQRHRDRDSAAYFTYGPVVLAHSIPATAEIAKRYPLPGFYDFHYRPDDLVIYGYKGGLIEHSGGSRFEAALYDTARKKTAHIWLQPMGGTVLRQVTFPTVNGAGD